MDSYRIPTKSGVSEYVDKRSRFLGLVQPVGSEDEARAVIAACKKQYHDARHNCWCYLLRDGTERYSDDGEPQGTAGIPMLEVFRRAGVTNAVDASTKTYDAFVDAIGKVAENDSNLNAFVLSQQAKTLLLKTKDTTNRPLFINNVQTDQILNKIAALGKHSFVPVHEKYLIAESLRLLGRINALYLHNNDVFVRTCILNFSRSFAVCVKIERVEFAEKLGIIAPILCPDLTLYSLNSDDFC